MVCPACGSTDVRELAPGFWQCGATLAPAAYPVVNPYAMRLPAPPGRTRCGSCSAVHIEQLTHENGAYPVNVRRCSPLGCPPDPAP
jgi:hypothetical protein